MVGACSRREMVGAGPCAGPKGAHMKFHIIIPARFASGRLPGKMLLEIAGKPLIQRVFERALHCGAESVTIATDDERIQEVARAFGANVCMTDIRHPNGTDRLSEAVEILNLPQDAIVVNIQGDEPLFPIEAIKTVAKGLFDNNAACMSTLCTPIRNHEEVLNPNCVKVVCDKQGFALYFSRAPIPYNRDSNRNSNSNPIFELNFNANFEIESERMKFIYYRHLGLYAYRVSTLKKYRSWERSPLECIESLEQLRILWHGEKIHVSCVDEPLPPGVDTKADLEHVCGIFSNKMMDLI